eukprot:m51a1_g6051 hypothetical protein (342) ;mRNA; f:212062-213417
MSSGTFTIFESDDDPARVPRPAGAGGAGAVAGGAAAPSGYPGGVVVHFTALDGSVATASLRPGEHGANQMTKMVCCPCLIGGWRSPERAAEARRMLLRFSFWASLLQVVMFLAALGVGGWAPFGENPQLGPTTRALVRTGAKYAYAIKEQMQLHRLFTAMLLHAGLLHLAFNLFAQMRLGVYAEARWGMLRYILVYVVSGVGATLTSCVLAPNTISVGASGGIMGVIAAFLVQLQCQPDPRDPMRRTTIMQLTIFLVLGFVVSLAPFVDFSAHIGGAIVGALVALMLWMNNHPGLQNIELIRKYGRIAVAVMLAVYFIVCISVFYGATFTEQLIYDDVSSE